MSEEVSLMDVSIIKNNMLAKSHKELSELVGLPIKDVVDVINALIKGTGIVTKQMMIDQKIESRKELARPGKPPSRSGLMRKDDYLKLRKNSKTIRDNELKIQREKAKEIRLAKMRAENAERSRKNANRQPAFKTKVVDYSKQKMVKIDRTTYIYVTPGKEKEQIAEFMKTYKRPIEKVV